MCKKQTCVSHSSTESEIIFLDSGLRLDGLLALEFWDLIVSVFGNVSHVQIERGELLLMLMLKEINNLSGRKRSEQH